MSATAIGFVGIYVLGLFLALSRHPIFGLLMYLLAFYNHPPGRWWGEPLPNIRWSLVAAIVTFSATVLMEKPVARPAWHANGAARILLFFTAWMWLQSVWAANPTHHLAGCILFTKYLLLFYAIYQIVTNEDSFELFSWGHIIGCFILGWIAYQMLIDGRLESVGGPGIDDSNTLGMQLTTGLAFAGFLLMGVQGNARWIALGAIPFILNGVILTQSRGAFLGMAGAGAAALFLSPQTRRGVVYGAASLGLVLMLILAHDFFWERVATIWTFEEEEMEESAASRVTLITAQWAMSRDHPFGVGHRGTEALSPHYLGPEMLTAQGTRAAHNTFMAVLVDQGYPGIIAFVSLHVWAGLVLLRLKRLDRRGLPERLGHYRAAIGAAFSACFLSGQFSNFLKAEVQIWLLALLVVLSQLSDTALADETRAPPEKDPKKQKANIKRIKPRLGRARTPPPPLPIEPIKLGSESSQHLRHKRAVRE